LAEGRRENGRTAASLKQAEILPLLLLSRTLSGAKLKIRLIESQTPGCVDGIAWQMR